MILKPENNGDPVLTHSVCYVAEGRAHDGLSQTVHGTDPAEEGFRDIWL